MTSPQAREAFDLSKEPQEVRERYGMNRFGQCCLLARRLIEAGVRFVTVNTFLTVFDEITWDIHGSKPFTSIEGMKDIVAPMYDQAYSALIEDLSQRGMLDNTLVCNLAEFGRTPRVNPAGGRDHWPQCWTVYFAGGGVQGRPRRRPQRRDRRRSGRAARRSGRSRRHDLSQPGPRPGNQAARPARPAVPAGRFRQARDPRVVLESRSCSTAAARTAMLRSRSQRSRSLIIRQQITSLAHWLSMLSSHRLLRCSRCVPSHAPLRTTSTSCCCPASSRSPARRRGNAGRRSACATANAVGQIAEGVDVHVERSEKIVKIEDGVAMPVGQRQGDDHRHGRRAHRDGRGHRRRHGQAVRSGAFAITSSRCWPRPAATRRLPRGAGRQEGLQALAARLRSRGRLLLHHAAGPRPARSCSSDPGRSLLLTKPTGAMPHKGGVRFDVDSPEYA